jgi:hypothetical protein
MTKKKPGCDVLISNYDETFRCARPVWRNTTCCKTHVEFRIKCLRDQIAREAEVLSKHILEHERATAELLSLEEAVEADEYAGSNT